MFRGFINDAKSAAGSAVAKQAARAWVLVPFMIALGFATAGIAVVLVEHFGHLKAYLFLAVGFSMIGLMAGVVVRSKEQEKMVADEKAAKVDAAHVVSDTAAVAAAQMPLALIGALLSSASGPAAVASMSRIVGRNLPLVALLVGVGILFWPRTVVDPNSETTAEPATNPPPPRPNGVDRSKELHQTA